MPTAGALACGGTVAAGRVGVGGPTLPGTVVLVSEAKGVELAWLGGGVSLARWLVPRSGVGLAGSVSPAGGV
jgi:hypothetical protein